MASPNASFALKWEYRSMTRDSEAPLLEALNEAGGEGWELVNTHCRDVQGAASWTAILKRPIGREAANMAADASAAPGAAAAVSRPAEPTDEEGEFEFSAPVAVATKPAVRPKALRPSPAKPRMELSDDFDFELASTIPGAPQPTKQTKKAAPATAEDDFDFELGGSAPAAPPATKPQPPKPAAESDDDTDFDLG
jgi:hypothetical protein